MTTAEAGTHNADLPLSAQLSILIALAATTGIGVIVAMDDDYSYESWKRALLGEASPDVLIGTKSGGNCDFNDFQPEQKEIAETREDIRFTEEQLKRTGNPYEIEQLTSQKENLEAYLKNLLSKHGHCPPDGQH